MLCGDWLQAKSYKSPYFLDLSTKRTEYRYRLTGVVSVLLGTKVLVVESSVPDPWCYLAKHPVFPPVFRRILVIKDVFKTGRCKTTFRRGQAYFGSQGKPAHFLLQLGTNFSKSGA